MNIVVMSLLHGLSLEQKRLMVGCQEVGHYSVTEVQVGHNHQTIVKGSIHQWGTYLCSQRCYLRNFQKTT